MKRARQYNSRSLCSAPSPTSHRSALLVAAALLPANLGFTALTAQRRPNIVFIYADDHAQHAISAYDARLHRTPHIDRLARDGMRFTQSFVGTSICGPARATILTGLHAHAHGQVGNANGRFRDDAPTWATSLRSHGYKTAMIGKWHLPTKPRGFDYKTIEVGSYYNVKFRGDDGVDASTGHVSDAITERALAWMQKATEDKEPFAIWVCHSAAHRTWMPALRHLRLFDEVDVPEPPTLFDDYATRSDAARSAQMRIAKDLFPAYDLQLQITGKGVLDKAAQRLRASLSAAEFRAWEAFFGPRNAAFAALTDEREQTQWKYQRYIKNYLRCVAGLDESVGSIRAFLQERGLAENTIVIYSSDQGFFLGDHGYYDKRFAYEEALRTPLIVSWPGVTPAASTCDELVQNIDMAPTLIAMATGDDTTLETKTMHGQSLVPLLCGPQTGSSAAAPARPAWRDAIYYDYAAEESQSRTSHLVAKHKAVRTKTHKLLHFYELGAFELFDLEKDPRELVNVYEDPSYATIRQDLVAKLAQLSKRYGE